MQRSTFKTLSLLMISGLAAIALSGCGTSNKEAATPSSDPGTQAESQTGGTSTADDPTTGALGSTGTAVFSYEDTTYSSDLAFCSLSGGEDALFHGVARDESGNEVGYLDGDFGGLSDIPYGEARIDFGATTQFDSADEFVAVGDAVSHIVIGDSTDTDLIVVGGAWDHEGTKLPTATLKVNC